MQEKIIDSNGLKIKLTIDEKGNQKAEIVNDENDKKSIKKSNKENN